ncbi:hypothetical protein F511_29880 [Dorcoceras hygrometricum]|uniref:Uncharacterized protein n=1 Tax=Dorcoceras hygrometricum TaxID=472368 RepID=A0A2Z7AMK9_9LAMI|nr:hypothetical protein F511_29880 [Dorcoceras hygrometricum]
MMTSAVTSAISRKLQRKPAVDEERSAGARRPAGELNNDDVSSNVSNQQEATTQTSSCTCFMSDLCSLKFGTDISVVIWVYGIFRTLGYLV